MTEKPRPRPPHWMGEVDFVRENAEHDRILQEEFDDAQEEISRQEAERFNEEHGGAYA